MNAVSVKLIFRGLKLTNKFCVLIHVRAASKLKYELSPCLFCVSGLKYKGNRFITRFKENWSIGSEHDGTIFIYKIRKVYHTMAGAHAQLKVGSAGDWSVSGSIPSAVGGDFFPKLLTEPCAPGSTRPLKMSTRIFLGVKMAGA